MEAQLNRVVELLRETFGEALAGAYPFGSAAQGGPKPTSDLDVLGVLARRSTRTAPTRTRPLPRRRVRHWDDLDVHDEAERLAELIRADQTRPFRT